jgi:hypothetical protein
MWVPLKVMVTFFATAYGQDQKRIMTLASCVPMRQSHASLGGIDNEDTKRHCA